MEAAAADRPVRRLLQQPVEVAAEAEAAEAAEGEASRRYARGSRAFGSESKEPNAQEL